MTDQQTIVVCEGVRDRAIWAGWLRHRGWWGPTTPQERKNVVDLHDKAGQGHFIFRQTEGAGDYCRIIPAGSDSAVLEHATRVLRNNKPTNRLIVCWDSDAPVGHATPAAARSASFAHWKSAQAELLKNVANVDHVVWWVSAAAVVAGLPKQHTLELVVCDAFRKVDPTRANAVEAFLSSAPTGPTPTHKHYAWSYMAKWFGDAGCDEFYQAVWKDPDVAAALESTLTTSGALASMKF